MAAAMALQGANDCRATSSWVASSDCGMLAATPQVAALPLAGMFRVSIPWALADDVSEDLMPVPGGLS